nr:hypothetical protein [Chloroflexia bacterium]
MAGLPSGTVTFLFTDIEGSTKRWERHPQAMAAAVARHDTLMREAIHAHHGHVFKTVGDAFCAAFPTAEDAAAAALAAQQALAAEPWDAAVGSIRVRMGLHTGEADERDADYFGQPVNRVARLMSAGHGGQVLISDDTEDHVRDRLPEGTRLKLLGKHRLKDLARPERIFQLLVSGLRSDFPRLKTQPSPYAGLTAAIVATLVALISFRFGTRSSGEEIGPALLSPLSLFTGFKGLVIELSTLNEYILLGVGGLILALAVALGVGRWRVVRREQALRGGEPGRFAGAFVNQRTVAFLTLLSLTVLGAYAYQQYLWRVSLPIPDGALGIALTREAAAATLTDELADALYTQGQAEQVVVRQLPVRFDARDTARARDMGERIGARAVIIYRADERGAEGQTEYVAYVVFTDPSIGLTLGGSPDGSPDSAAGGQAGQPSIQVKEGVPVPVLRTETLDELVNAAAGIIAYDDDRAREAIGHLELAVPDSADAPNTGIVNFYLGNAYNLDSQSGPAATAYERAAAFYEQRQRAGEILGPQDGLILAKTYLERGRVASFTGDWATALAWYERGLGPRADVLARASGLERPTDVHATYARLYTLMADAYRFQDRAEDQRAWEERARDELLALATLANPTDSYALVQQSTASFFIGDCVAASEAVERAGALDPSDTRPLTYAGIIAMSQGRPDIATEYVRQVIAANPDDIAARHLLANILVLNGLTGEAFETAWLLESEAVGREIIALDPTNIEAHENLAESATLRGQAAESDATALLNNDMLTYGKSQILWPVDAEHRQLALDAYGIVIEERRILAAELQPGDAAAEAAVAHAYLQRELVLYGFLLNLAVAGDQAQLDTVKAATGEQILADAARVREWTDRALANPAATRLDRLMAWSARTQSLEREWSWYRFFAEDAAKADALEAEFRKDVAAATTFGEAEPVFGIDEIAPLRIVYFEARAIALVIDNDQVAADAAMTKIDELTAQERTQRTQGITHYSTFCAAEREREAGDASLAKGDAEDARTHYVAALKANPTHAGALGRLAAVQAQEGDIAGAVTNATAATEAAPDNAALWADLARYQLIAGDAGARDTAYDRCFALAAEQPPQERMATVGAAIAALATLVETQPAHAPGVAAVVPRFGGFLDGMAADGEGTFQYPSRYAELGRLALDADGAALAEPLLRRSLTLDPHQPAAHANLVIAVLVQNRDAATEIDAAFAEATDPLWPRVTDYNLERVLTLMEDEAKRYAERFPDRAAVVEPFTSAIPTARERLDWQRRGVAGTAYTSPTYGYGVRWVSPWSVVDATSDSGTDFVELSNGLSTVLL